jgi:hypothetical protein
MVTLQISPYTNMTLGWITLFMGDMGEGALHQEESNCQAKKIRNWSWAPLGARHQDELADRPLVAM